MDDVEFQGLGEGWEVEWWVGRTVSVFTCTTIVAGPGAAMAAMWAWREETLAKREKVVVENK